MRSGTGTSLGRGRAWSGAVAVAVVLASGIAHARGGDAIRVMTRNQYLGANLTPLVTATTPQDFAAEAVKALDQIAANDFPKRARALAREVRWTRPDVIGLQEVFDFTLNGTNPGPPFVDHLQTTLDALAARGLHYRAVASVEHVDTTLAFDLNGDEIPELIRVRDRDVILVRRGLRARPLVGNADEGGLCGVEIANPLPLPFLPPTLAPTVSEDGCNFSAFVRVVPPLGDPILQERGFVGVDLRVRGRRYRVVNTHFEVRQPDPSEPLTAGFQSAQAFELLAALESTTPANRTLVLVGDFNSAPEDLPAGGFIPPPYQLIRANGFADAWDRNLLQFLDPAGATCCQDSDLANTESRLDERIDHIFVNRRRLLALAFVTGRFPQIFPLDLPPNWASDHGGVAAKLVFPRHRRRY